jgi:hypothetical protein
MRHNNPFLGHEGLIEKLGDKSPMIELSDERGRYEGGRYSDTHVMVYSKDPRYDSVMLDSNFEFMARGMQSIIHNQWEEASSDTSDRDFDDEVWCWRGSHELWARVYEPDGVTETLVFQFARKCLRALKDYPYLDENDVSLRENDIFSNTAREVTGVWCRERDIMSEPVQRDLLETLDEHPRFGDCRLDGGECDQGLVEDLLSEILPEYWAGQYRRAGVMFGRLVAGSRARHGTGNVTVVKVKEGLAVRVPFLPSQLGTVSPWEVPA